VLHVARLRLHKFGAKGHAYTLDCDCPGRYRKTDPHKIMGVTTALNAKAKPALTGWAGRVTAEYAIDHWDELTEMPLSERLDTLRSVQFKTKSAAALRGNQIHELGQRLVHNKTVDVSDENRGPVEAYARFCDRWEIEPVAAEVPVANTSYRYGGTADLFARVGRLGNALCMIDLKTGRSVYSETSLQVTAYARCDLWQPDGPASEGTPPVVEACYVAHIQADNVLMLPAEHDQEAMDQFLYALAMARDDAAVQDNPRIHAPIDPPGDDEDDEH
jgi:hypothetical protein